jgi:two-component system C4-dicarboxylate transport response regulator DctD
MLLMAPLAGRILIVDDDAVLLKVMEAYLSRLGYLVDACSSAAQALALLEAGPSLYTGALVDLNMPGMRGEELVYRILDWNASIRLVVVSGNPAGFGGMEALDRHRVSFLNKPFAPQELAGALTPPTSPATSPAT